MSIDHEAAKRIAEFTTAHAVTHANTEKLMLSRAYLDLAGQLEAANKHAEIRFYELERMRLVQEKLLSWLSRINLLCQPERFKLPDGRVMEFDPRDDATIREYWKQLSEAVRQTRPTIDAATGSRSDSARENK